MSEDRLFSANQKRGLSPAISDFRDGLVKHEIWRIFAWDEIQQRYRRSYLGLSWIVISYAAFVFGIFIFFGSFSLKVSNDFLHYVAIGYSAFTFVSGNLVDGCDVFRSSATWIKSTPLPYSIYVYKGVARSTFPFCVQILVAFMIMYASGWRPNFLLLYALPALFFFIINAIWIQNLCGLLSAKWPDIGHLVVSIQRLLFLSTPIMWVLEERGGLTQKLAKFNPLTHFVEIFRAPVLGTHADLSSWVVVCTITMFGVFTSLLASAKLRHQLPFWIS